MALTGTEAALSSSLQSLITAKLTSATSEPMLAPTYLAAICDGIAEAIIPHIVANTVVVTPDTINGTVS